MKKICTNCGKEDISDPIWDFCSMECYYENYIKQVAKATGIPRRILEGTEAGDTRLYD